RDAKEASSGTKSATPIAETPQSISVITGEDISALGLANLNQTLRYVAGVTPETRGANAEIYDQFKLRGFDAPRYLDGLKLFASASGYA
ncbi:TonB-dependent receptor plug domain-containing protein, partial [Shewanella algae]|uniref:TonB-dependent receptor plug domain-containing protein n=1 Tax=Shewanella algae TaxID=38313 RepID=UPI00313CAC2F